MKLTMEMAKKLRKGYPIIFENGDPTSVDFIRARVILIEIYRISCLVEITEILETGEINKKKVGDRVVATYSELEPEPE